MSQDTEKALADETDFLVDRILDGEIEGGGIIGGFPCQDISIVKRNAAGLAGERSGLFWKMAETVRMVRPKYWLMENVAELLNRGMGVVLGEVACGGGNAEWDCVGAGTVGAPHHRARTYILADYGSERGKRKFPHQVQRQPEFSWCKDVRSVEALRERPDLYPPQLCGGGVRVAERLHGIGNGNPHCVIRELTKDLK